jgi:radical SAM protein with 4Fe4S-binding SPASM domain
MSGRSTKDIDVSLAKDIVEAFIQTRNISINSVRIVFIGGGEPLLNFSAVTQITSFARLCAARRNMNIVIGVITNGSLLNDKIISWFDKERVRLNISFEILPDEQTRLRGNFIDVMNAIKLLQLYPTVCSHTLIRSTLTESNVNKQLEMLRYAKVSMPWISKYSVEPVTDASFLNDYTTTISFLSTFRQEYEKAKDFASRVEFRLSTSFDSHLGRFIDHACAGQFGLTPHGAITSCGCMTSPHEPYYRDTLLKDTFDDFVGFFQSTHKHTCPLTQLCESCYARYCCAGGCFIQNKLYDMNVKKAICETQKEFLRRFLIKTTYRELSE